MAQGESEERNGDGIMIFRRNDWDGEHLVNLTPEKNICIGKKRGKRVARGRIQNQTT